MISIGSMPSLNVVSICVRTSVWFTMLRMGTVLLPGMSVRSVRVVVPIKVEVFAM